MKRFFFIVFILSCCLHQLNAQTEADLYTKAQVLKKERKCNEALPLMLKALEQKPNDSKLLSDIGWCFNEIKQFDKAITHLQKSIQSDSSNTTAYAEIGYSYYSIKMYSMAISNLNIANTLQPKTETTLYYLGLCFVRISSKADAVKKYNELSLMNSNYAGKLLNEIKAMK